MNRSIGGGESIGDDAVCTQEAVLISDETNQKTEKNENKK